MPASTADSLQVVADACKQVVENVTNLEREYPHILRKVTLPGGQASFRFTTTIIIDGTPIEVQVRTR